jgi:hypothetical protein
VHASVQKPGRKKSQDALLDCVYEAMAEMGDRISLKEVRVRAEVRWRPCRVARATFASSARLLHGRICARERVQERLGTQLLAEKSRIKTYVEAYLAGKSKDEVLVSQGIVPNTEDPVAAPASPPPPPPPPAPSAHTEAVAAEPPAAAAVGAAAAAVGADGDVTMGDASLTTPSKPAGAAARRQRVPSTARS